MDKVDMSDVAPCYSCKTPAKLEFDNGRYSIWCPNFRNCKVSPGTPRLKDINKCKKEWLRVNRMSACEVVAEIRKS